MTMAQPKKIAFEQAVAKGMTHQEAGRLNEAEAAYRAALAIVPGHALVTHNLGVIAAARGDHRIALGYFDEATAAQPHYASAHYNRGVALIALDRLRDAIQSLSRACAVEPDTMAPTVPLLSCGLGQVSDKVGGGPALTWLQDDRGAPEPVQCRCIRCPPTSTSCPGIG